MTQSCMCGDLECPSCGVAQGNSRCPLCVMWMSSGCVHVDEMTGDPKSEYIDAMKDAIELEMESLARIHLTNETLEDY